MTKRREVLERLVTGMTTAEIAEDMGINERCVSSHIAALLRNTELTNAAS